MSSPVGALLLGVICVALYMGYRAILPKPIAGIPYNRDAAGKMFGDIPEMMRYVMRTKRIFCWLTSLTTRHQSPIVQAFIKPGGLPWVVVTDPFESQDILLRRIKEFDRSEFFGPFRLTTTSRALDNLEPVFPDDVDEALSFPEGFTPDIFSAVLTLANSVTDTQLSPAPVFTSWAIRKFPYMRKAEAIKDKYIQDKVEESVLRMETEPTAKPKSALHSVLVRERDVAAKEGREPEYRERAIADEFFGFMTAGHDTSATTIAWGLKMLTDNPTVQRRLRDELRSAFPQAIQEKRDLTYTELSSAAIPYLDTVVDEVLRHANTIAFVARQALQDTTVLGHHIPKGTNVFLMANGPGYLEPSLRLKDDARSPGARQTAKSALTNAWSDDDVSEFKPERWLERDSATGAEVYNSMAGPSLAFGMGLRGCFGRTLALQVLKIHFSLIVWHFELLPTPEKLSGYDAVQKSAREPTQCFVRLREIVAG